ncbi:MAG: hypothetical protein HYZ14_05995 [Bacteroidetes bacterium]|nr:hypothetical protein [Bacteroidota bacterium]
MRNAQFYVPKEAMPAFALELSNREMDNTIEGITEEAEIIVSVEYERDEEEEINELEDFLQGLLEQMQQRNEEEE